MSDKTVLLQNKKRKSVDVATELTKVMIERKLIATVEEAVAAFQKFYNVAEFASENIENPFPT